MLAHVSGQHTQQTLAVFTTPVRRPLWWWFVVEENPQQVFPAGACSRSYWIKQTCKVWPGFGLAVFDVMAYLRGYFQPSTLGIPQPTVEGAPRLETGVCRHTPLE